MRISLLPLPCFVKVGAACEKKWTQGGQQTALPSPDNTVKDVVYKPARSSFQRLKKNQTNKKFKPQNVL